MHIPAAENAPQALLSRPASRVSEEVHCLSKDRPRCYQRQHDPLQGGSTPPVVWLAPIDDCHERPRIGQYHLRRRVRSIRRNATPDRRARPPLEWTTPMMSARRSRGLVDSTVSQYCSTARRIMRDVGTPSAPAARPRRVSRACGNRTLLGIGSL
jgi:hypothetical protein